MAKDASGEKQDYNFKKSTFMKYSNIHEATLSFRESGLWSLEIVSYGQQSGHYISRYARD